MKKLTRDEMKSLLGGLKEAGAGCGTGISCSDKKAGDSCGTKLCLCYKNSRTDSTLYCQNQDI